MLSCYLHCATLACLLLTNCVHSIRFSCAIPIQMSVLFLNHPSWTGEAKHCLMIQVNWGTGKLHEICVLFICRPGDINESLFAVSCAIQPSGEPILDYASELDLDNSCTKGIMLPSSGSKVHFLTIPSHSYIMDSVNA